MPPKYSRIRETQTFLDAYSEIRVHLRQRSPAAYLALPSAMIAILDIIEEHPRAWPVKRKKLSEFEVEFHHAIKDIAYRRIHVRYLVDEGDICYLLATWIDGQDEPRYVPC